MSQIVNERSHSGWDRSGFIQGDGDAQAHSGPQHANGESTMRRDAALCGPATGSPACELIQVRVKALTTSLTL